MLKKNTCKEHKTKFYLNLFKKSKKQNKKTNKIKLKNAKAPNK
jgi:hypothetical protein